MQLDRLSTDGSHQSFIAGPHMLKTHRNSCNRLIACLKGEDKNQKAVLVCKDKIHFSLRLLLASDLNLEKS